jgi:hypothetical protein
MATLYIDPQKTLSKVNIQQPSALAPQPGALAQKSGALAPQSGTLAPQSGAPAPAVIPKTPATTTSSNLDPNVIALAKAIRQQETGNRPIAGKTGELPSRYQFMPGTWKSSSEKYLGGGQSHDLTLENENTVAYNIIKDLKDQGYNPGQIASIWNSGHPDPYYLGGGTGKGESSKAPGVYYDVPKYTKNVYNLYKNFKKQGQVEQAKKAEEQQNQPDTAKKPDTAIFGLSDVPVEGPMSTIPEIAGTQKAMETGAGLIDVVSNTMNKAFSRYSEAIDQVPFLRLVPKAIGGVVGSAGAAISGIVGAIGETGKELVTGDHLDAKKIWDSAYKTGADTAQAGYKMGVEGTKMFPLALAIGYAPAIVGQTLAGQMIYSGLKEAIKGKTLEDKVQGVLSALTGGLGFVKPIMKELKNELPRKKIAEVSITDHTAIPPPPPPAALGEAIDAYRSIANPTKTQMQKIETKGGKSIDDIYSIMAQEGVMPVKDGNRLRILEPEIDKLFETKKQIDTKISQSLSTYPDTKNNLLTIKDNVIKNLELTEQNASVLEDKISNANNLIDAEIRINNDNPILSDKQTHDIKNGMWTVGYDLTNNTKASVARRIGFELKNQITANNPDLNIQKLNELSGKYADAIGFAKSIDGNIIKGGKLGNWFSIMIGEKILTNTLGHVPILGRFTSMFGALIGKNYSEYINNPERVITEALNELKKTPMDKESTILMKQFDEAFKARKKPLQLPAPKKPGTPGAPALITSSPTTYEPKAKIIGGAGQSKIEK